MSRIGFPIRRFDTKELERISAFLLLKARKLYKALWEKGKDRARLTSQLEKRRSSLLVSRGDFEEEIYRVR